MAGVITRGNFPAALQEGVKRWFRLSYDEHPMECRMAFNDGGGSRKAYEEEVATQGLGLASVKGEGNAISYDSHSQGFTSRYIHGTYAKGVIVTREEVDDNLYMEVGRARSRALGFSMRQTEETVAANVYNNGFDTTNYPGADGVAMLATNHPSAAGNQANEPTTATDFDESSLEDLLTQIMTATDDRGLKISLIGRKLIVPPQLWADGQRVLKSELQSGTANNDVNALRVAGMLPEGHMVYHYLTDTDAWFILTNEKNGPKYFERRAVEITRDNDFDTENMKMKATQRYSYGWSDFRGVYGSPGA